MQWVYFMDILIFNPTLLCEIREISFIDLNIGKAVYLLKGSYRDVEVFS